MSDNKQGSGDRESDTIKNPIGYVTLRIDKRVIKQLKRMAITNETTVTNLVGEAIMTWLKWMKKAEATDQVLEKMDKTKAEMEAADRLLQEIISERRLLIRRRDRDELPLSILRQRGPLPLLTRTQIARMSRKLVKMRKRLDDSESGTA